MSRYAGAVLKQLDRVFNHGTISGLTEGKLLERFVEEGDEAAFAALVARHGPMVLGVCRRILRNETDVEDAFQATFLVLVRRAGAISRGDLVSHWLHGVAHRVAVRARAQAARRRVHEPTGLEIDEIGDGASAVERSRHELRWILDEELARLPGSLRSPVVLCYLEGLTHDEAAQQLRWPVGTVRSRLARARDLLRTRLARQGMMTDGAALTAALARQPVPLELIDGTVRASIGFTTKQAAAAGVASTTAAALARGVLHAMTISKITFWGVAAVAGILALGGAPTLARQFGGTGKQGPTATVSRSQGDRRDALLRSADRIDQGLVDLIRRNQELHNELRALRQEIAGLRSDEPESPKTPGMGVAARPEKAVELAVDHTTVLKAVSVTKKIAGTDVRAKDRAAAAGIPDLKPMHHDNGEITVVTSSRGDRVAVYNRWTGETKTVRFPVPTDARHRISPQWGSDNVALALHVSGPAISRVAVYINAPGGGWYPHDLREPVDKALPIVGGLSAIYTAGRYVYGFTYRDKRWVVLELPEGSHPLVTQDNDLQSFAVASGRHLYYLNLNKNQWDDVDLDAILDVPPAEPAKDVMRPGRQ